MAADAVSDEALLQAVQERQIAALVQLYDRHARLAYGLAYRMLQNRPAADEVVLAAFRTIWRAAATGDPPRGPVRPWLLAIVHHQALAVLRQRAPPANLVRLDQIEGPLAGPDRWPVVATTLAPATIRQALAALPSDQQRALELAYFAGFTQPEIARALGVPLRTVSGWLRQALQSLHTVMAGADRPEDAVPG